MQLSRFFAAAGIFVGALAAVSPATGQDSAPEVQFIRFSPVAIFGDGKDEMSLEVRITGDVESARAVDTNGVFRVDGDDVGFEGEFELFESGTDRWSRTGITSLRDNDFGSIDIVTENSEGVETEHRFLGRYYIVNPDLERPVEEVSANVQRTDHLVNINDETGDIIDLASSTSDVSTDMKKTARRFYQHFPDEFDFLSVFTGVTVRRGFFHRGVSKSVGGIGSGEFDNTDDYGSDGRLKGMNFMGLSPGGPLLHETSHSIGVFLDSELGLDDGTPHWGAVDIPGFLFGLDFERREDDDEYLITWTRSGGREPEDSINRKFPPMELYLWGLIAPEDVSDTRVLEGVDPRSVKAGDIVTPDDVSTVTVSDIIDVHGPRDPPAGQAPNTFSMAGILVTPDRPASDAEMALWSRVMQHFGSEEGSTLSSQLGEEGVGSLIPSFYFATDGRGAMSTTIDAPESDAHLRRRVAGNYFNVERDGEGCQLTLEADDETMILTCYTYLDGEQVWMIGSGTLRGDTLEIGDMAVTQGADFGGDFSSDDVERIDWGTVTMQFKDCNSADVTFNSRLAEFESFSVAMTKIVPGDCDRAPSDPEDNALAGNYFDPARDGEGFQLAHEANGEIFILTYYTYLDGNQVWLLGTGLRSGDSIVFDDMTITEGADFGTDFDSNDVNRTAWGTITMEIQDCNNAVIEIDPSLTEFTDQQGLRLEVKKIVPGPGVCL